MNGSDKEAIREIAEALKEQQASINANSFTCRMLHAQVIAHQAAIEALIASHPNPRAAFDSFTDHMDAVETEEYHPEFVLLLRAEMQSLQKLLARAASSNS